MSCPKTPSAFQIFGKCSQGKTVACLMPPRCVLRQESLYIQSWTLCWWLTDATQSLLHSYNKTLEAGWFMKKSSQASSQLCRLNSLAPAELLMRATSWSAHTRRGQAMGWSCMQLTLTLPQLTILILYDLTHLSKTFDLEKKPTLYYWEPLWSGYLIENPPSLMLFHWESHWVRVNYIQILAVWS